MCTAQFPHPRQLCCMLCYRFLVQLRQWVLVKHNSGEMLQERCEVTRGVATIQDPPTFPAFGSRFSKTDRRAFSVQSPLARSSGHIELLRILGATLTLSLHD
ncbi:hypothetical protein chiPu_0022564 [Chiloscyllium punctatum]|uniref:Uncharacterized protein n=1 Tax=Chiloscyllium punctatum TaxID=137246 RepID=A0A401RDY3_CHIPU|nr:hypothetical protein [Chiloscyllium punctatum]